MFSGNILFFINRTSSNYTFFAFSYILAIEEIDKTNEEYKKGIKEGKGSKDK